MVIERLSRKIEERFSGKPTPSTVKSPEKVDRFKIIVFEPAPEEKRQALEEKCKTIIERGKSESTMSGQDYYDFARSLFDLLGGSKFEAQMKGTSNPIKDKTNSTVITMEPSLDARWQTATIRFSPETVEMVDETAADEEITSPVFMGEEVFFGVSSVYPLNKDQMFQYVGITENFELSPKDIDYYSFVSDKSAKFETDERQERRYAEKPSILPGLCERVFNVYESSKKQDLEPPVSK